MALIKCNECGNDIISDESTNCPQCGCSINTISEKNKVLDIENNIKTNSFKNINIGTTNQEKNKIFNNITIILLPLIIVSVALVFMMSKISNLENKLRNANEKLTAAEKKISDYEKTINDIIAIPEEKYYIVTFNSNGGSSIKSQSVKENETAVKPVSPTKNNYTFIEWQFNGTKFDFNTKITEDLELNAVWKKNLTTNNNTNTTSKPNNTTQNTNKTPTQGSKKEYYCPDPEATLNGEYCEKKLSLSATKKYGCEPPYELGEKDFCWLMSSVEEKIKIDDDFYRCPTNYSEKSDGKCYKYTIQEEYYICPEGYTLNKSIIGLIDPIFIYSCTTIKKTQASIR